jgi:hypothetical protein
MKWAFLTVLVVVIGAVAAIGIYARGWHDNGRSEADERALGRSWTLELPPFRPLSGPARLYGALQAIGKDPPEQGLRPMERAGFEPATSGLQSRRSPS